MSSAGESRVVWTCPECSRVFRIPRSKPQPRLCVKCSRKEKASGAAQSSGTDDAEEMYFQEADRTRSSPLKFGVVAQPVTSPVQPQSSPVQPQSSPVHTDASYSDSGSTTSIDELSNRVDQILEHLEGISRTMKLVRWVMWGLGFATVVSVVVTAGGVLYSISMMGSLGDLLNQPAGEIPLGELPGNGAQGGAMPQGNARIPPQLQEQLKPIQEYSNVLNELLDEVNQ